MRVQILKMSPTTFTEILKFSNAFSSTFETHTQIRKLPVPYSAVLHFKNSMWLNRNPSWYIIRQMGWAQPYINFYIGTAASAGVFCAAWTTVTRSTIVVIQAATISVIRGKRTQMTHRGLQSHLKRKILLIQTRATIWNNICQLNYPALSCCVYASRTQETRRVVSQHMRHTQQAWF